VLGFSEQAASSHVPSDAVVDLVTMSAGQDPVAVSGSTGADGR